MAFLAVNEIESNKQYSKAYIKSCSYFDEVLSDVGMFDSGAGSLKFKNSSLSTIKTRLTTFESLNFESVTLSCSEISSGATLRTDILETTLYDNTFRGFMFRGGIAGRNSKIVKCNFYNLRFIDYVFSGVKFKDCKFYNCVFDKCAFVGITSFVHKDKNCQNIFESCDFDGVVFERCNIKPKVTTQDVIVWENGKLLPSVRLVDCTGSGIKLRVCKDTRGLDTSGYSGRLIEFVSNNGIETTTFRSVKDIQDVDEQIYKVYGGGCSKDDEDKHPYLFLSEGL